MRPPIRELFWEEDDSNVQHLWQSHQVRIEETQDVLFGIDGEDPYLIWESVGQDYAAFGETSGGRLLKILGEFRAGGAFRIFHAMDMNQSERRRYRRRE